MKYILGALLLLVSRIAWSCTCDGTAPIELAIAGHPILVEGEVVALDREDTETYGTLTHSATLRVKKVLKGSVDADEITVVHTMCYASLAPYNMELNHTYVLPLADPAPEMPVIRDRYAVATIGPDPGQYEMAHCAHSGLELIDGGLYTFERDTIGLDRRLQYYMPHRVFRGVLPVMQAVTATSILVWTLDAEVGLQSLALALIFGTAGAYLATRYRPWMLAPVLLLAGALWTWNLAALLISSVLISEHGAVHRVLSWIAPAIIAGGGVLGYLTSRRARAGVTSTESP